MNRRLKTVPLREFLGEPNSDRRAIRAFAIGFAIVELTVVLVIAWRVLTP